MRPSLGARDTVSYLPEPTFSPFSAVYITKTTEPVLIKIMSLMPYSLIILRIKFERNQPSGF